MREKFAANPAVYSYPRQGPNNKVKEMDLRIWETLYIDSLKVLGKWDQYNDIARALQMNVSIPNNEMMIDNLWAAKNWSELAKYEIILRRSENLKHKLILLYMTIKQQNSQAFDDLFKSIIA